MSEERIEDAVSFLELEECDEDFVDNLEERIKNYKNSEDEEAALAPDSKLDARNWLLAYAHYEDENKFLSDYKKVLEEKYITPIKSQIDQNKESMSVIKTGLAEFLEKAEEKKVKFPDIGTISEYTPPKKVLYPEDEDAYAQKLLEEGSEFVVNKPSLDKKKIKDFIKDNNKLPLDDLYFEDQETSVRFTRARKK